MSEISVRCSRSCLFISIALVSRFSSPVSLFLPEIDFSVQPSCEGNHWAASTRPVRFSGGLSSNVIIPSAIIRYPLSLGRHISSSDKPGRVSSAAFTRLSKSHGSRIRSGGVRLGTPIPTRARIRACPARLQTSRAGFISRGYYRDAPESGRTREKEREFCRKSRNLALNSSRRR